MGAMLCPSEYIYGHTVLRISPIPPLEPTILRNYIHEFGRAVHWHIDWEAGKIDVIYGDVSEASRAIECMRAFGLKVERLNELFF